VLTVDPQAEAVVAQDGRMLLRNGTRTIVARGLRPQMLEAVLAAVGSGSRPYDEVRAQLAQRYTDAYAQALLDGLIGTVLAVTDAGAAPAGSPPADPPPPGAATIAAAVAVVGDGPLADAIAGELAQRAFTRVQRSGAARFASCEDAGFRARRRERVPLAISRPPTAGHAAEPLSGTDLDALLRAVDLCVCALEWVPYRAQLDVADAALRTGTPVLFVTAARDGAIVGPTYVPGATACFECERIAALGDEVGGGGAPAELIEYLSCHGLAASPRGTALAARACAEVAREVQTRLAPAQRGGLLSRVARLPADGERSVAAVAPSARCSRCSRPARASSNGHEPQRRRALADVVITGDRNAAARPGGRHAPPQHGYRSVGVLGGGTAGYLAALTFRRRFPEIAVTLIESSTVGVIGVGEATTPRLVEYLHTPADLGRGIVDFHERVRPIWKLGVLYQWGRPGDYAFPWPFQYGSLLEPYLYDGDISEHCLGALLMAADRVPVFDDGDGSHTSLLDAIPFAYHLDNPSFVRYLREEAEQAGVSRLDRVVVDADLSADGENVDALITDAGERLRFDLYVDCSGFRSVLLEGRLKSPYVSYEDSLFTDRAVVANVPHDGTVKPYTVAESMANGWCWNIAFEDEDHRGYVYSSAFCSDDEAEAEMRAKNPGMGDAWTLRFRSGRHEQFWKGNVVALGNAYAFVEPLASTAIHMLLFELDLVSATLPAAGDVALKDVLNRQANEMWDNLRGWLAVQYRFNRKFDTPFWRTCRADVDLAAAAPHVVRFRARAPLASATPAPGPAGGVVLPRYANDYFAQEYVYDVMLFGQDVECRHAAPHESREQWRVRRDRTRAMVDFALPQAEALALARRRPELLAGLVSTPGSWLGEHLY
jgi:tryptophan halogenase